MIKMKTQITECGVTRTSEEDRLALAGILVKFGYSVRIGKAKDESGKNKYFVEYWEKN